MNFVKNAANKAGKATGVTDKVDAVKAKANESKEKSAEAAAKTKDQAKRAATTMTILNGPKLFACTPDPQDCMLAACCPCVSVGDTTRRVTYFQAKNARQSEEKAYAAGQNIYWLTCVGFCGALLVPGLSCYLFGNVRAQTFDKLNLVKNNAMQAVKGAKMTQEDVDREKRAQADARNKECIYGGCCICCALAQQAWAVKVLTGDAPIPVPKGGAAGGPDAQAMA